MMKGYVVGKQRDKWLENFSKAQIVVLPIKDL